MGISSLLYPLTSFLLQEWESLYKLVKKLSSFFIRERNLGIYEILDYETTLELSATGKTATFLKRQKVKFLQDNVISFQDYMWGDSDTLAHYNCSPGKVVDWYKEGDRWNILVSLLQTKSRGDIEEFFMQTTVRNGFTNTKEWQQLEIRHHTQYLKIVIIFPKQRYCRHAVVHQRSRHASIELNTEHFHELPDGRQVMTWEIGDIEPLEVFTVRWEW